MRDPSNQQSEPANEVYLRLSNASDVSFDSIFVRHDSDIDFGALPARGASEYRGADGVYRYAYVQGKSGEDYYLYQPIDFAGEVSARRRLLHFHPHYRS
jgi:hypothetical protein